MPGCFIFCFQELKKDGPGSYRFQTSALIQNLSYMAWIIMDGFFDLEAKIERVPKF